MTGTDSWWWAVALHEAGHCAVYLEAGCPIKHSWIGRASCGATYGCTDAPLGWNTPLLRATAALAGPIAEQAYTGASWEVMARTTARLDFANVEEALAMLGARCSLDAVIAGARAAVERNRPAILTVARELVQRRYLDGEALVACLAR
jgi:hypothetical protein